MEKLHYQTYSLLIFSAVFSLYILAFVFCIVAEFKKSKVGDVKLDGRLCELPKSEAYGFGVAALICSAMAQIVGSSLIIVMGYSFWEGSSEKKRSSCCQAKTPTIATTLLAVSWLSFGGAAVLTLAATSMNKKQPYGKGWLNGECYVVKEGIFIVAAILILLSLGCTLASAAITMRKKFQVSTDEKAKKSVFGIK